MSYNKAMRHKVSVSMRSITGSHEIAKPVSQKPEDPYRTTKAYLHTFERYAWRAHVARGETEKWGPKVVLEILSEYETYRLRKTRAKEEYYTIGRYLHQYRRKDTRQTHEQVLQWYNDHAHEKVHTMRKWAAVVGPANGRIILRTE